MKTYRIILKPRSSITSLPSSDTLFGAICWGIRIIYGENVLNSILAEYNSNPKFIVSSSFPVLRCNDRIVYFYPKPLKEELNSFEIESILSEYNDKRIQVKIIDEYKEFKKIEFVSESIFNRLIIGNKTKEVFKTYLVGRIDSNKVRMILVDNMLIDVDEYTKIFDKEEKLMFEISVQRNMIDRLSLSAARGETFYSKEYFLNPKLGVYFLIKTDNIDFFIPIFRYLEDTGIGKDRYIGKGCFKFETPQVVTWFPDVVDTKNYFLTLSKFIINPDEIDVEGEMFYELVPCFSKIDSIFEFKGENVFKDKVIYAKEGSIFKAKQRKEFYGQTPVVKKINNTEVLQNGLAFPVFIKVGE